MKILGLFLVCSMAGMNAFAHAQRTEQPAPNSGTQSLIDPRVLDLSDGIMRRNNQTGLSEAYLPIISNSSHAPNLLHLRNGDVLCFWFTGTWEGESGDAVVMSRLKKGAHRWTGPQVIDRKEGFAYMNPVAMQDGSGVIHLYHTDVPADGGQDTTHLLDLTSVDNGKTWSVPQKFPTHPGVFTGHSPVSIDRDTWLLPLSYQTGHGGAMFSDVQRTSNAGKSWVTCSMPGSESKTQPSLVILGQKRFVAYLRSHKADSIYRSISADGCHWSLSQATELPNNDSSIEAQRLRNGHIIMAFDNSSVDRSDPKMERGLRKPLTVAISENEGLTWRYVRDLEVGRKGMGMAELQIKVPGREEYSFPTICQLENGTILVAYNYRRQTIKVVAFHESWVHGGGTVGQFQGRPAITTPRPSHSPQ